MTLIYDTFVIKYVHSGVFVGACVLFFCLFFIVLITEVVLWKQIGVLSQRSTDLLLLLEATRVGDLDVAALCGRFIYYLLQSGIELAVHMVWRRIVARVCFVAGVTAMLSWDLIKDLRFRFLLA